jgi:uncharacterized protein (TIGR02453 family)
MLKFEGFSKESPEFLKTLYTKNSKKWFEKNRVKYEKFLLEPFRLLVAELGDEMLRIDSHFEVRPQINKTISKIFRDTRFSKDKSIFKRAMWLTFKRPSKDWKDAPAYFFELMPDSYRYGLGYYSASRSTMDIFRESINDYTNEFVKAIASYRRQSAIKLWGEKYKRPLPCSHQAFIQDWYQRKSFYLAHTCKINRILFSEKLKADIITAFNLLSPLYKYLLKHIHK